MCPPLVTLTGAETSVQLPSAVNCVLPASCVPPSAHSVIWAVIGRPLAERTHAEYTHVCPGAALMPTSWKNDRPGMLVATVATPLPSRAAPGTSAALAPTPSWVAQPPNPCSNDALTSLFSITCAPSTY